MRHHHHSTRHSIGLGAAWEPPASAEADGRLLWKRRFGRPRGLEPADLVLLVFMLPAVATEVVLNGAPLPALPPGAGRWSHDITPLLRERNELCLVVAASAGGGMPQGQGQRPRGRCQLPAVVGVVALEIVTADDAADRSLDA